MKIAILSGKGGTGKTFVAVNLAAVAPAAVYIDCDVEEPNGRLFFEPQSVVTEEVFTSVPLVHMEKCVGCRRCTQVCQFNALLFIRGKPRLFPQLCHSCGGCMLLCPEGAMGESKKRLGVVETGVSENVTVITGILDPGEASGVAVIRQILKDKREQLTIIDCPPGSGCPAMESIMDADHCVLVAEPTAFGLHNLQMVYELVTILGKKCSIVINKESDVYGPLDDFCAEKGLDILARIPFSPSTAALCSAGKVAVRHDESLRLLFLSILRRITEEACL